MLKRILLSVVMIASVVPLYGVKVMFVSDQTNAREYTILKSCIQTMQEDPEKVFTLIRQKTYTLSPQMPTLELDLDPQDDIQIFTYIRENSPTGFCNLRLSIGNLNVIQDSKLLINDHEIIAKSPNDL